MMELLTADSLYAHVLMQRQTSQMIFAIFEGSDEDRLLTGHLNESDLTPLIGGGKAAVYGAGLLLHANRLKGAVAVIDRDLDDHLGISASYPPTIVATASYDLVGDVIRQRPELLMRTMSVHSTEAYAALSTGSGGRPMDLIYLVAMVLAPLRLVNEQRVLGLKLRKFPFEAVIQTDLTIPAIEDVLKIANSRSGTIHDLEDMATDLVNAEVILTSKDCGGHDLLSVAAGLLRACGASGVSPKSLTIGLFSAVDSSVIKTLPVFEPLQKWAAEYSRRAFAF
ncbi:hypothetical protein EYE40_02175 [Glaciihabitans arcticus]|uniref:DUF4435 domain-containing protein n=1 Tax=Glaciihabitans arcticus TaxID=2668039 RepID=A0A4Q9GT65_9MICO|nr:hypothetical protein [Glaciihabitans arcticus]TBN56297.1 hypothetical protein EYE40_02175 [Glaciihabitans arcticus]